MSQTVIQDKMKYLRKRVRFCEYIDLDGNIIQTSPKNIEEPKQTPLDTQKVQTPKHQLATHKDSGVFEQYQNKIHETITEKEHSEVDTLKNETQKNIQLKQVEQPEDKKLENKIPEEKLIKSKTQVHSKQSKKI